MTAGTSLLDSLPEPYFSSLVASIGRARRSRGGDMIDLARGNPDVPPPDHVIDALATQARRLDVHGYPPFAGLPALAEAFASHYREVFGVTLDPEREVLVVPGTKTAICLCAMALAGAGRGVIIPDPGYPDYPSGIALAGAQAIALPLDPDRRFAPAWGNVAGPQLERAGMAFLNWPSNPCGTMFDDAMASEAIDVAGRAGLALVHDNAYGELVYGGRRPRSFLAVDGAMDVAVELYTMSKTYCMAGSRIGFVAGAAHLIDCIRTVLDHLAVGVFLPIQHAAIAALTGPQDSIGALRSTYEARARKIAVALGAPMPEGSYYVWWKLPGGVEVASLLNDAGVAVADGAGFGERGVGWARVSVTVSDDELDEGLARIAAFVGTCAT